MLLNEIEPFVRQAVITNFQSGIYPQRRLKTRDCRLFYILHGNGEIVIENRSYRIKAGSTILFQTGTEYMWKINDMRYIAINFDYTAEHKDIKKTFSPMSAELFPDDNFSKKIHFEDAEALNREIVFFDGEMFESRITNLAVEIHTSAAFRDELLSALLKSIIISIVRLRAEEGGVGSDNAPILARQVIGYIQENYARPIKGQDIADHFHFNPTYIGRVFKSHTGFTLRTFIVDYRINRAKEILRTEERSVSETAMAVGFTDVPHFIKTFRAHVGKTPLEYKKGQG